MLLELMLGQQVMVKLLAVLMQQVRLEQLLVEQLAELKQQARQHRRRVLL